MLTAYDALTASILESCGVDMILVGDSVGMVLLGYGDTRSVSVEELLHHAKAVRRGARRAFVVADLPYEAISKGPLRALEAARRFIREAGADAVKLEWNAEALAITEVLVKNNIPVMGHVGLTPQTVTRPQDFGVRGRDARSAKKILEGAVGFERRGAFSVVLECIPSELALTITRTLKIPTIGIGAGAACDGQVLVFQDLVGLFTKFKPKFVKRYLNLERPVKKAVTQYIRDVKSGKFPDSRHSFPGTVPGLSLHGQGQSRDCPWERS